MLKVSSGDELDTKGTAEMNALGKKKEKEQEQEEVNETEGDNTGDISTHQMCNGFSLSHMPRVLYYRRWRSYKSTDSERIDYVDQLEAELKLPNYPKESKGGAILMKKRSQNMRSRTLHQRPCFQGVKKRGEKVRGTKRKDKKRGKKRRWGKWSGNEKWGE